MSPFVQCAFSLLSLFTLGGREKKRKDNSIVIIKTLMISIIIFVMIYDIGILITYLHKLNKGNFRLKFYANKNCYGVRKEGT